MRTHCRQWACGHCDCLGIFLIYRLTTFDVRIRRQKSSKSANRVFYISLNKGYFGKAIFSRLFSARYHILKKKKKKRYWAYVDVVLIITLSILATCLVSSNCSVTHVRWGKGTSSVLFQWRPAFSRSVRTHCRQWACGHCDCLGIFLIYRLTTFDVRIRRQKSSKSANRVFYISLNKGYFGKAIFSRLFSARYHILKKKKKKKDIGPMSM